MSLYSFQNGKNDMKHLLSRSKYDVAYECVRLNAENLALRKRVEELEKLKLEEGEKP